MDDLPSSVRPNDGTPRRVESVDTPRPSAVLASVQEYRARVIVPILLDAVNRFNRARHEDVQFERATGGQSLRVGFKCWDNSVSDFARICYTGVVGEETLACSVEGGGKFQSLARRDLPAHFETFTHEKVGVEVNAFIGQFFAAMRTPVRRPSAVPVAFVAR